MLNVMSLIANDTLFEKHRLTSLTEVNAAAFAAKNPKQKQYNNYTSMIHVPHSNLHYISF